ncbi:MAG: hypothetical protein L0287_04180 [Anaerolineae bacterium]|nr:hypothetical protein [Anaerolineae bacterium]
MTELIPMVITNPVTAVGLMQKHKRITDETITENVGDFVINIARMQLPNDAQRSLYEAALKSLILDKGGQLELEFDHVMDAHFNYGVMMGLKHLSETSEKLSLWLKLIPAESLPQTIADFAQLPVINDARHLPARKGLWDRIRLLFGRS